MTIFDQPLARWVILHILNGDLFYISIALLTLAMALATTKSIRPPSIYKRTTITLTLSCGLIALLTSLSSITLPWLIFLALTAITLLTKRSKPARILIALSLITLGYAVTTSIHYETARHPATQPFERIAVFGDSLSVPFGDEHRPAWPALLQNQLDIPTTNRAAKGARVADALTSFNNTPLNNHLIILVISGNDFLGSTPYEDYTQTLNQFIRTLQAHNNQIIMLEIPAPPTAPHFAWAQKSITSAHRVRLIPKRTLAAALFQHPGATVDGLHLTKYGHQIMAQNIIPYLR